MDPAQMAERCPHSPRRGSGWLEGWRLAFGGEDIGWEGAMATVVEEAGQRVFVVLYELSAADEASLDQWDGVSLGYYRKTKVRVATPDGEVLAWLYVLNEPWSDRKSTRLNSSHQIISYAVFCLKKKKKST